jgi:hypothetical protein
MSYNLRNSVQKSGKKVVEAYIPNNVFDGCKVKENNPVYFALIHKADILEKNNENQYKVQAYRNAAGRVATLNYNLYSDKGYNNFRHYDSCVKTNEFIEKNLIVSRFVKKLEADYRVLFPKEWRKNITDETVEKAVKFIKAINKFRNRKNKRRYAAASSKLNEVMNNITDYSSWGKDYYMYSMSNIQLDMTLTVLQFLKKNGLEAMKTYEIACLENYCIE